MSHTCPDGRACLIDDPDCHARRAGLCGQSRYLAVIRRETARRRGEPIPERRATGHVPPSAVADIPTLDPDTFVTSERLARDTLALMARLPPDVDLVVGVSRSGLLPASLIAYHRHLPLRAVSRARGVVDMGHGVRLEDRPAAPPRHVLLIDDTVANGTEMRACAPIVRAAFPHAGLTRAVVYAAPQAMDAIDLCAATYPGSHFLAWNWTNSGAGSACGYDVDGLLCRDFTPEECRSEASYLAAMAAMPASPYLPRRRPIPMICTARPESARSVTLGWLARWGASVENLWMWPGDPHPRAEDVASWKAMHYKASGCVLFAESEPAQAEIIVRESGKPVLCPILERVLRPAKPARQIDRTKPRMALGEAQRPRKGCVSCSEKALGRQ